VTLDTQGRVVHEQVVGLAPIIYGYDSRGRLSSATIGTGSDARTFSFSYNSDGYVAALTDPLGRSASFSQDAAGRMVQQTFPDGRDILYAYDANGNLTMVTPPGRPAHAFSYSSVNLLAAYAPPNVGMGTTETQYTYNADWQLVRATLPDGQTVDISYDSAGRLSTLTLPNGQEDYTYDATTDRLASVTAPGGVTLLYNYDGPLPTGETWTGPVSGTVSRTYNNDTRLASESVNGTNNITFQYDPDNLFVQSGALSLSRDPQHGLVTGTTLGNVTDTWTYNSFAEGTNYRATVSGTDAYSVQYSYDKLGRVTQKTETIGGGTDTYDYTYDGSDRLSEVRRNGVIITTYTYDSNGNRLSATHNGVTTNGSYDAQDRLTQYGTTVYTYTANGEALTKTAGNQITTYGYDVLGNLRTVTLPDGTQIEYLIDGQNRRIGKRINGALVQGFLYKDGLNPIAELDSGNNVVSRFVYAGKENVPDYMVRGGVTYRIISDHLGSPRLVVDVATDAIAQRLDYDEFGNVLLDTNLGFQPFGFAGGQYDPQTKFVHFGARDYDAETGRWTAKDPIRFAGDDTNLFVYVSNDPINQIDPFGTGDPITQIRQMIPFESRAAFVKRRAKQIAERIARNARRAAKAAKDFAQGAAKKGSDEVMKCELYFLEGLANVKLKDLACQSRGLEYDPNFGQCVIPHT
jgi:RHS repeat-associated protein